MEGNLKQMMPVLEHVGMTGAEIELLADEVPQGIWKIRQEAGGLRFVVSCENNEGVGWFYIEPEKAKQIPTTDEFIGWLKKNEFGA